MLEHLKDYTEAASVGQLGILGLAQRGMSSSEIPQFAIRALSPHFLCPSGLTRLPESVLMTTLARVAIVCQRAEWAAQAFRKCLDLYRRVEATAGSAALEVCRKWSGETRRCEAQMLTEVLTVKYDDALVLDQEAMRTFGRIGSLTESFIQVHLRELLDLSYLLSPSRNSLSGGDGSFGDVVQELLKRHSDLAELLGPPPWKVKLHRWRNVAQHKSWRVSGQQVICSHGQVPRLEELVLTSEDLRFLETAIDNVMLALGAARAVFLFDRADPPTELVMIDADQYTNPLYLSRSYAQAVASYGFEITELAMSDSTAHVTIRDRTDQDPRHRKWFVISLAYHLCSMSGKDMAEAIYVSTDGKLLLKAHLAAEDCARIKPGEWEKLIPHVRFTDLQTGAELTVDTGTTQGFK